MFTSVRNCEGIVIICFEFDENNGYVITLTVDEARGLRNQLIEKINERYTHDELRKKLVELKGELECLRS
jgi:hypothetical protein